MLTDQSIQPPNGGIDPHPHRVLVTVQEATRAIGDLVAFDMSNADAAVDNMSLGSASSGLSNVRTIDAEDLFYGQLCVMQEAVTDGQQGYAIYRGRCKAKVQKGTGDIAIGDPLYVGTAGYLDADATAAGTKIVARAAEAVTGPATATLATVIFEGIFPLGIVPA